jgi:hypothetical protein
VYVERKKEVKVDLAKATGMYPTLSSAEIKAALAQFNLYDADVRPSAPAT